MSQIGLEGVTKQFGAVTAVDDVTLSIEHEEFMVLLGPSGCGKTTVLRVIAGLDRATSGTVRIGERVVNDVEAKDRNISMVFQSYALYPHLSVFKNIESPLVARRIHVSGEAEDARRLAHPAVDLVLPHLPQLEAEGKIVVHGHVRVERVALEDH